MNNLERLHRTSITATDIASQYWCEKQMELYKLKGPKKATVEIKRGKLIHEQIEASINEKIELEPKSYSDSVFKTVYSSYIALSNLKKNKRAREIQIYGSFSGYKLVGKIDELKILKGDTVLIEDKTRSSNRAPGEAELITHKVQVTLYKKLIDDIVKGNYSVENFKRAYHTQNLNITDDFKSQLSLLGIEPQQQSIDYYAEKLFDEYAKLELSNNIYLRYINQFTKENIKALKFYYSEKEADKILKFAIKYWNGDREALPVPFDEKWKCNHCTFFGNECKVWWPQRTLGV